MGRVHLCVGLWLLSACSGEADLAPVQGAQHADAASGRPADGGIGAMDGGRTPAMAALEGTHDIVGRSCEAIPLPQDWPLEPGWRCDAPGASPGTLQCNRDRIRCTHQSECQLRPFGRCIGSGMARCDYGPTAVEQCGEDADCVTAPMGNCAPAFPQQTLCYPSGECVAPQRHCVYSVLNNTCDQDSDCDVLPGGTCHKAITSAQCQYNNDCATDDDCTQGSACACVGSGDLACVLAECRNDGDCGGRACRPTYGCAGLSLGGFHCASERDLCQTHHECDGGICVYSEAQEGFACAGRCSVP